MEEAYKKRIRRKFSTANKTYAKGSGLYLLGLGMAFNYMKIPSIYYSLDGYCEDAICLEYNNGEWIVYNGEKGNKYNIKQFNSVQSACHNMILRISESDDEQAKIQRIFEKRVREIRESNIHSLEIQISILTKNIQELREHLKVNPQDHHSRKIMLDMIDKRKVLLTNFKNYDDEGYHFLIKKLKLIK